MIVIDLETSGTDLVNSGIWQIGAVDFENPKRIFLEEGHIDNKDKVSREAMTVTGKTEKEIREKNKRSQKQLLKQFFKWCEKSKIKNYMCENPQFDVAFLETKARKYNLKFPFHYRAFDLHSIAQARILKISGKILVKKGHSAGFREIIKFCGMKDERNFHNALEDAKLTAECFSRIFYGKNMIKEYDHFKIPKYLKN
ncbi:MAG: 3'-5' exonuclease [Candidatus Pacearchaeota archaeon]|nr:3'-5' exonuclease [Candidatus Pacearchaeota archaeon]